MRRHPQRQGVVHVNYTRDGHFCSLSVVGLDKGSLSSFASGEQRMIEAYDKAIQSNGDDSPVCIALEQQRSALIDLVREMQRKAA